MLAAEMATTKKATPKRPTKPKVKPAETRGRSLLVEIGEDAMRAALLKALRENGWNLTHTAAALRMSAASSVIRALHNLGLDDEYEKAKKAGHVRPGARPRD